MISLTCRICGKPVKAIENIYYSKKGPATVTTEFTCFNEECRAVLVVPGEEAEALARFSIRTESAWNMFRRLKSAYTNATEKYFEVMLKECIQLSEQEAILRMQQFKKELSHDRDLP